MPITLNLCDVAQCASSGAACADVDAAAQGNEHAQFLDASLETLVARVPLLLVERLLVDVLTAAQ